MKDCFNLTVDEYHDVRSRNKSEIIVKSCFAWLCTDESPVSGMAMLEMDIPSGYIMLQVCISKWKKINNIKLQSINQSNQYQSLATIGWKLESIFYCTSIAHSSGIFDVKNVDWYLYFMIFLIKCWQKFRWTFHFSKLNLSFTIFTSKLDQ